jgi:citrate synthase
MEDKQINGRTPAGIPLTRLVEERSFEDVVHILLLGALREESHEESFHSVLAAQRELPEELRDLFRRLPRRAPVMDCMIAAAAWLGAADPDAGDGSRDARIRQSVRMIALLTVVAAVYRVTTGRPPIRPLARLTHARNFLYMLSGHGPDEDAVTALDDLLILVANGCETALPDHGDYHSAVTTALCALKASGIGTRIDRAITTLTEQRERGYGDAEAHRATTAALDLAPCGAATGAADERAQCLKRLAGRLSECAGETAWQMLCEETGRNPNTTEAGPIPEGLYSGLVLHLIGIPPSLYMPVMGLGMVAGWSGRILGRIDASPGGPQRVSRI